MLTNMNSIKLQLDRFNCFHAYCHHYIEYYQKMLHFRSKCSKANENYFIVYLSISFAFNICQVYSYFGYEIGLEYIQNL